MLNGRVNYKTLPNTEARHAAEEVLSALVALSRFIDQFAAAVSLFNYCQERSIEKQKIYTEVRLRGGSPSWEREPVESWPSIAGRDGALTIYNIEECMKEISQYAKLSIILTMQIDFAKIKQARQLFKTSFPHSESIRHSVAHAGEQRGNITMAQRQYVSLKTKISINRYKNKTQVVTKYSGIENFRDNNFSITREGREISYELSSTSYFTLQACAKTMYEAFRFIDILDLYTS